MTLMSTFFSFRVMVLPYNSCFFGPSMMTKVAGMLTFRWLFLFWRIIIKFHTMFLFGGSGGSIISSGTQTRVTFGAFPKGRSRSRSIVYFVVVVVPERSRRKHGHRGSSCIFVSTPRQHRDTGTPTSCGNVVFVVIKRTVSQFGHQRMAQIILGRCHHLFRVGRIQQQRSIATVVPVLLDIAIARTQSRFEGSMRVISNIGIVLRCVSLRGSFLSSSSWFSLAVVIISIICGCIVHKFWFHHTMMTTGHGHVILRRSTVSLKGVLHKLAGSSGPLFCCDIIIITTTSTKGKIMAVGVGRIGESGEGGTCRAQREIKRCHRKARPRMLRRHGLSILFIIINSLLAFPFKLSAVLSSYASSNLR